MHSIRNLIKIVEASDGTPTSQDYEAVGIDPKHIPMLMQYGVTPQEALNDLRQSNKHKRRDNTVAQFIDTFPEHKAILLASNSIISRQMGSVLIATDEDMFETVVSYVTNNPDILDNHPETAIQIEKVLLRLRMQNHSSPIYRGECPRNGHPHTRKFHSWSGSEKSAGYFWNDCPNGKLFKLVRSFQGVSLDDIVTWRLRFYPKENHYGGSLSEWLVLDPPELNQNNFSDNTVVLN